MSARLTHKKSRKGCLRCKRRKVKCDEKIPQCTPCTRHRVSCSFNGSERLPALTMQRATLIQPEQMLDLRLLHNFTAATSQTLSDRPRIGDLFRTVVVEEAFKQDFLLHSLLCVSGFHMARCSDTPQKTRLYSETAMAHYNATIQLFRKTLVEGITSQKCHAIFACSGFIFVASCAQPRHDLDYSRVLEWFNLARGITAIVNPRIGWIFAGPLAEMVAPERGKIDSLAETKAEYLDGHFESLSEDFLQNSTDPDNKILKETMVLLRNTFIDQAAQDVRSLFRWPMLVSPEYLGQLIEKIPEAMVIFAYYCTLLCKRDSRWWVKGWPEFMIKVINKELNGRLEHWMKWPLETIGMLNARRRMLKT